jgi:hypothetical protein
MIYSDTKISEDVTVRQFDDSINPIELKWHRDDEYRTVVALEETDWMIQLENRLPQSLNSPVFISMGEWHRLIKGTHELKIKIVKSYE